MQRLLITPNEAQSMFRPKPEHGAAAGGTMPDLPRELLPQRQELLPRFGACYTQLRALPRRVRRALQRKWKQSLAGVALLLALGATPGQAATIPVSATCSLVNAIRAANTDTATAGCPAGSGAGTIRLPVGSTQTLTTVNNSTYGPTGLPVISSAITIEGHNSTIRRESNAPEFRIFAVDNTGDLTLEETTVSGGIMPGSFQLSYPGGGVINHGILTLTDSTLSGNSAYGSGGGVWNDGTLTLTHSTLSGNSAYGGGGGVFNYYGTLTLTHSTLSGNASHGGGGGVTNGNFGTMTIQNSTISGNRASYTGGSGGGVINHGTLTIADSTLSGNAAYHGGGVINLFFGTLTIADSTLSGNAASFGGGAENYYGTLTLTNSTLSGNSANVDGGGVFNFRAPLTITNSTLSGNAASFGGGGVYNSGDSTLTLAHTLVSGNTAPRSGPEIFNYSGQYGAGTVIANNFNLFGHDGTAGVTGFTPGPTDVVPTVPLSDILNSTLANNGGPTLTHALVSGSLAIDAIPSADPGCSGADQRGVSRPQGIGCDIGAFEKQEAAIEVLIDIKPTSINPKSKGVIPVAILTTRDFDATTVDPLSVEFGPNGALEAHGKGHIEDANKDGKRDLVLHFRTQETGIRCGETSASLTGETFDGDLIQGADSIRTVGCKKK